MHFANRGWVVATLASALACGCASQKNGTDQSNSSFSELRQQELAEERQDFIKEHREQLDELENRISRLEARLGHEAKFVEPETKAEWSQELFDLRQQHQKARAELTRAENATPQEWVAMRGDIGYAIDTLQAGVAKAGDEISRAFSSDDDDSSSSARSDSRDVDLCSLSDDDDETTAQLSDDGDHIVVQMVTTDQDDLDELRERARALAQRDATRVNAERSGERNEQSGERNTQMPNDDSSGQAQTQTNLIKDVTVENIASGVRVVFDPEPGQHSALKRELSRAVERIQDRSC